MCLVRACLRWRFLTSVQRIFSLNLFTLALLFSCLYNVYLGIYLRLVLFTCVKRIFRKTSLTLAFATSVKRVIRKNLFTLAFFNVCETYIS